MKQQQDLNHFYYTCLKRVLGGLKWSDSFFSFLANEPSLDDQCRKYWDKYLVALSESIDGELLLEHCNRNIFRENWVKKQFPITGIFHSKRYIEHTPLLERIIKWCSSIPHDESIPNYDIDEIMLVAEFSNTF